MKNVFTQYSFGDKQKTGFDFDNEKEGMNDKLERELEKMGALEFNAPENAVRNILGFARSYEVLDTKVAGKVEMVLN